MSQGLMKIGELAKCTGAPVETIRYYEREGLLPAASRSDANYRLYGRDHLERLQFIRHCRSLDMALDEIRELLRFRDAPDQSCGEVNALLDRHIGHVADRIAQLQELQRQLGELRSLCSATRAVKDCGIYQTLATMDDRAAPNLGTHGGPAGSR